MSLSVLEVLMLYCVLLFLKKIYIMLAPTQPPIQWIPEAHSLG